MFDRERTEPERIELLKVLLDFLPPSDLRQPSIATELSNRMRGYKGEREVDFYLRQLPNKPYHIINGLRLVVEGDVIQIDTLILTSRYAIITEIKNYSGKLIYDTVNGQLIQIRLDGTQKRIGNPLSQGNRQRLIFMKLLRKLGLSNIPIVVFAVNSDPWTILQIVPDNPNTKPNFFHAENLAERILEVNVSFKKEMMNHEDLNRLIGFLKKSHRPPTNNLLMKFEISVDDLNKGVPCPQCGTRPMKREYGTWCCICGYHSKTAHEPVIRNYLKLVKTHITNRECRDLLGIDSADLARRILMKMGLEVSGKTKTRIYHKKEKLSLKMKVAESKAKVAESEAKVAESKAKVAESKVKVAESEVKVAESEVEVPESRAKVAESKVKVAESEVKVAESEAKVAESEAKVAESTVPPLQKIPTAHTKKHE